MLNGIPPVLSPRLLMAIDEMGHGDEITITDGMYPQMGMSDVVIRADGLGVPELLRAIVQFMPLDHYNDWQYGLMATVGDDPRPSIWDTYAAIVAERDPDARSTEFERFAFYEYARHSHVTVVTSETAQYANIILRKGVVLA
ncbi:MAG: RbsD/FucU domain-containing protein [Actinomycetaceae bacterium]|nr:RbsD/FucU domain-containing protein [Actinomycetaceae bacterium]MDY6082615.1 RbsD/FucU domain-containing protein [Actinomycetaceae bacterium]